MYSGYESMSTIAGEIKNPQVIPKGTLITIPLIMAIYILVGFSIPSILAQVTNVLMFYIDAAMVGKLGAKIGRAHV